MRFGVILLFAATAVAQNLDYPVKPVPFTWSPDETKRVAEVYSLRARLLGHDMRACQYQSNGGNQRNSIFHIFIS